MVVDNAEQRNNATRHNSTCGHTTTRTHNSFFNNTSDGKFTTHKMKEAG